MKVSLNWIRLINDKYQSAGEPAPEGIEKLVEKIGGQLGAVEEVVDLGKRYKGLVAVKVVTCEKHSHADKLSICLIDDGGVVKDVKRNKQGYVEIVCGAPNVKEDMLAAWIPPGVQLPASLDKDPYRVESREIRGVLSHGMLASPKELGLSDSHEGLLVVDEPVKPGTPFAKVYKLDDYIIDIENKMFTHRPDLFGMLGIAREIAGMQQQVFKSPGWYREDVSLPAPRGDGLKLVVKNEQPKLAPRFCAVAIRDVAVKPSPIWLQTYLSRVRIKPVNNIVDLTNFVTGETAQPVHAYDYDKVKAKGQDAGQATLLVRKAKKGEELRILGGKNLTLDGHELVIATAAKAIGLAGVMGGADTEVDEGTKNLILECATFEMGTTRKTAMTHGLFTEAATRFTKNQSPRQNLAVMVKLVEDILNPKYSGGRLASQLIDIKNFDTRERVVRLSADFISSRLGLTFSPGQVKKILENVEFSVKIESDNLTVKVPFWRTDIEIPEDITEEVGRLHGYDKLPRALPSRDLEPLQLNPALAAKSRLRHILTKAGGNEVLTYSFVRGDLLDKVGQDKSLAFKLSNALSPDLQYYRLSLLPSLLEKIHPNIKAGFGRFAVYEIGHSHIRNVLDDEKLPAELERLSLVVTTRQSIKNAGAPFYEIKKLADFMFKQLGIPKINYKSLKDESKLPVAWQLAAAAFEPGRSAAVRSGDTFLGLVGEPTVRLRSALKLPAQTSQAEFDTSVLLQVSSAVKYRPLNRYPSLDQDLCLRSSIDISYEQLSGFIVSQLQLAARNHGYIYELQPLDVFQRPEDLKHKQTTWRITFVHPQRTLTTPEVNRLLDELSAKAKQELGVERV